MAKPKSQPRRGGGHKQKLTLVFDPAARQEFLTGFHKRKLMKKAVYKTKLDKKMAEEKERIKSQARGLGRSSSHSVLPEVEALLAAENPSLTNTTSYDLGAKTVTITSLDSILQPLAPDEPEESNEPDPVEPAVKDGNSTFIPNPKFVSRTLQSSAIFKKLQRLKQKSKKSKPKRNPHYTNSKEKGETKAVKGKNTNNNLINSRKGKSKQQKKYQGKKRK